MPIREKFLYGLVKIETSPWATPFVWTDRTADLVAGFNYSIGGRVGTPGSSQVDVGTLNATFKNLSSVPNVGALVRISITGSSDYAFVGYVQDVSQRIVFDQSVSLTTPITLTTLYCADWVGYMSQFNLEGIGGNASNGGAARTDSSYPVGDRVFAINTALDATGATAFIELVGGSIPPQSFGDTDLVATVTDHLDLISKTVDVFWYPAPVIPTNTTTGRDSLLLVRSNTSNIASGKTFTDVAGSAGQLHYTEIDFENSSQEVANVIIVQNRCRMYIPNLEVTKIGGFNEENYLVVNGQNVVGVGVDKEWSETDSTSIVTYGQRRSEFQTNTAIVTNNVNLISNPSVEYSDDGYTGSAANRVRRRRPENEPTPFTAYDGQWAMRSRSISASSAVSINFSGGESDGIPVIAGQGYWFKPYALRFTGSSTNMRALARINWFDDDENQISQSAGSNVGLITANEWYPLTVSATAPANATRATVSIVYSRTSGANIPTGDCVWADGLFLSLTNTDYFDGDTPWTSAWGYVWTGGVGASPSYKFGNKIDENALRLLTKYSTSSLGAKKIRWNAQEDLTAIPALRVGYTIQLVYKGSTTTYRIVGIDGNIDPSRYMIDYYLEKV
jgi:hypothetical protein